MITNGYTDLETVKEWLGIDDEQDDLILERTIEAASRAIDGVCNRRFYLDNSTSARTYDPQTPWIVIVDDIGDTTGLVIKTDNDGDGTYETTWASTEYQLGPSNAIAKGRPLTSAKALDDFFPKYTSGRVSVEVSAKWGWPSVPTDIEQATVILATRHFKRKDSPQGVLGVDAFGVTVRLGAADYDVMNLLSPYIRRAIG